jgi:signal transduction histidine kinase
MHLNPSQEVETPSAATDLALVQRISAIPTILRILCDSTGLGFGAVARVTGDSWTACAVLDRIGFGLEAGGQLEVATTFCHEIHRSREPIVIEKASEDPVYCGHLTPKLYGFESYVAVPIIRRNGEVFGTICALDPKPARFSDPRMLPTLHLFAELIAAQIEMEERLNTSQAALVDARESGALRDQFIAVLGHDLRNPIAAVDAGLRLLSQGQLDETGTVLVGHMRQSCRRMSELVNNVLDFARGKLGGGIPLERQKAAELDRTMLQVIDELRDVHPGRIIHAEFDLQAPVSCDQQRIGQLLSNLVGNALSHGAPDKPVRVTASSGGGIFRLSVSNQGTPIPASTMARLFQPFTRAGADARSDGLGLGLYIASEIARSHAGALRATSTEDATTFTLEMPTGSAAS